DLLLLRHLGAGDRLLVEPRVPKAGPPDPALARAPGWGLALAQNQLLSPRRLQMLALLAPPQVPDREPIRLIRPKQVWFGARPAELTAEPFPLHWAPQPGYPAPSWSLLVPRWPLGQSGQPVRPKLEVWWSLDAATGATPLARASLPDKTFQGAHDVPMTAS